MSALLLLLLVLSLTACTVRGSTYSLRLLEPPIKPVLSFVVRRGFNQST